MSIKLALSVLAISLATVICNENASTTAFWKGTILDSHIEKMRSACAEKDSIACFQYNAFKFLDGIFRKDYFHVGDSVQVTRNNYASNEIESRSYDNLEDSVEDYIKKHDVKFRVPLIGDVTVDSSALDSEQVEVKWNFGSGRAFDEDEEDEGRSKHKIKIKKSKIKKILSPILIFILLKAITLVPFAIGVLGLKAWNGLQLAFISFIISAGLAIFQLCQKLAADHAHAHISTAGPWESVGSPQWGRSLDDDAQKLAYSAYAQ
ncbi:uncharacterized protein LOC114324583 [Diabrotica virgifera virgifera]|uniref:Osiris 19 n=1 Tax=Diabrotica virgifera virgifera TaxID=50390 RepID=A0ABM5I9X8_DIAVI|nr:uncharacterized protein LOC114324583 [Diabrotica virgifera virgifera]